MVDFERQASAEFDASGGDCDDDGRAVNGFVAARSQVVILGHRRASRHTWIVRAEASGLFVDGWRL